MATNPMQRKARNSFLLGMLLMLIIASAIIGVLLLKIANDNKKKEEEETKTVSIYVLNTAVESGQVITTDMLSKVTVLASMAPENAITDATDFMNYSLVEKNSGNPIRTETRSDKSVIMYYVNENQNNVIIEKEIDDQGNDVYYTTVNNAKVAVELRQVPLVAKVNMYANTPLTLQMVAKSDEIVRDDYRIEDLSMIMLPIDLAVDDYIDIRLQTPSGQNYIVVSKKRVLQIHENTIWLQMSEDEIAMLSNAVVEAYTMTGSKLYANVYSEPGLQDDATPTYPPTTAVREKILNDPNAVEEAKNALMQRYGELQLRFRNEDINSSLELYSENATQNIEQRLEEETETRQELRNKFLEGILTQTDV